MNEMTPAQKLIADFYGKQCKEFFPNTSGVLLVEVVEMGRLRTFAVLDLAKRIMAYKRRLAKGLPC
jgi:hypothetical protein